MNTPSIAVALLASVVAALLVAGKVMPPPTLDAAPAANLPRFVETQGSR